MNIERYRAVRAANRWMMERGWNVAPHASRPGYFDSAKRRGFPLRTTSGMIYHLPDENRLVGYGRFRGENDRCVLFFFGESIADLELACAHIFMAHKNRTDLLLISCKGERP